MMVTPLHSSTPRWVPTASMGSGSGSGSSQVKSMATSKRKRDDADDEVYAQDAAGGIGSGFVARRPRLDAMGAAGAAAAAEQPANRPTLFLSGFHPSSAHSTMLTPSAEHADALMDTSSPHCHFATSSGSSDQQMQLHHNFPPTTGVAWLGHPLQSGVAMGAGMAMPTPPLTPSASVSMQLDGDSHAHAHAHAQPGFGYGPGGNYSHDHLAGQGSATEAGGFNGVDYPASMFVLQLQSGRVGHAHPYASV
ncbi:hypothetical protein OC842_000808 [Tilletia horrida]|uniref:Uncharacterized protein n=1 Tax=Tilletia horrida TaxID=155126 RepID=A0AAN6JTS2_9BASI|nr:hypothetical protein OC842_000808 [Tilletia horrida]